MSSFNDSMNQESYRIVTPPIQSSTPLLSSPARRIKNSTKKDIKSHGRKKQIDTEREFIEGYLNYLKKNIHHSMLSIINYIYVRSIKFYAQSFKRN